MICDPFTNNLITDLEKKMEELGDDPSFEAFELAEILKRVDEQLSK